MAADAVREAEAREWIEGLIGDVADEPWIDEDGSAAPGVSPIE
jgi:hypothetical protein